MILAFGNKTTEDIYHGENTKEARAIPKELWPAIRRKLDMLDAAHQLKDLAAPPGNKLEMLKGGLRGFYSMRVNDQYRLVFQFENGQARHVRVADYH